MYQVQSSVRTTSVGSVEFMFSNTHSFCEHLTMSLISHKYRGSCVAFSISKSVEPNEELKVG
jgi:hypothetical protein